MSSATLTLNRCFSDIGMCSNPSLLKTLQSASDRGLLMRVAILAHMAVLIMHRPANAKVSNANESTGLLNLKFHTGLCC